MLTPDDLTALGAAGFVRKPAVIDALELDRLRVACDRLLSDDASTHSAYPQDFKRPAPDQPVGRIEYLFEKDPAFLALAAHPKLLHAVGQLYQAEFVVTWEDLLIKAARVGFYVYHHQDSLYQSRRSPVYRFGIYLDRSHPAPVRFLPGSQRLGALSAEQISAVIAARGSEELAVPAEAGDVIIHDTMLVHSSEVHRDTTARRVIYLEYRKLAQLHEDSPWGASWIARRRELLPLAASVRASIPDSPSQATGNDETAAWTRASITPVEPSRLVSSHYRVDHEETENLAWHGLPLPASVD